MLLYMNRLLLLLFLIDILFAEGSGLQKTFIIDSSSLQTEVNIQQFKKDYPDFIQELEKNVKKTYRSFHKTNGILSTIAKINNEGKIETIKFIENTFTDSDKQNMIKKYILKNWKFDSLTENKEKVVIEYIFEFDSSSKDASEGRTNRIMYSIGIIVLGSLMILLIWLPDIAK